VFTGLWEKCEDADEEETRKLPRLESTILAPQRTTAILFFMNGLNKHAKNYKLNKTKKMRRMLNATQSLI
jgi:hypothetical protein